MAPCALGSLVEVLVNATGKLLYLNIFKIYLRMHLLTIYYLKIIGAPKREDILVTAYSPSGRPLHCPLQHVDDTSSAIFKPDEPGTWEIAITYQGKNIQVCLIPFFCFFFFQQKKVKIDQILF